eukprot:COSAG01_NODE_11319_length_1959_cov_19.573118_4_plen_69_part_00
MGLTEWWLVTVADKHPDSGQLELRYHDGRPSFISKGFLMENTEVEGNGASTHSPLSAWRHRSVTSHEI